MVYEKSVSGKSVSGKSGSGKSVSGKSVSKPENRSVQLKITLFFNSEKFIII
jgi:ABC-type dipeptide/oligopeptide/nickel transport system ATPase component